MKYLLLILTMFFISCGDTVPVDSPTRDKAKNECSIDADCKEGACLEVVIGDPLPESPRVQECVNHDCNGEYRQGGSIWWYTKDFGYPCRKEFIRKDMDMYP